MINTILGAGFVGSAILNWWVIKENKRLNDENRTFSIIQSQFISLYAPLYRLVLQNEDTINLYDRYHQEYKKRFINTKWSDDPETQKQIKEEAQNLLDVASGLINNYVVNNNERIIDIIKNNAGHIDPEDIEVFNKFEEHYKRLKIEFDSFGKLIIPLKIYDNIGSVSYFLPEFAQRVKEKYDQKLRKMHLKKYKSAYKSAVS